MYVKEEECNKRYCPFKMSSPNADSDDACDGSQCMAWRWKPVPNTAWKPKSISEFSAPNDYRLEPPPYIDSDTEGYCGMATRPSFNV